MEYLRNLVYYIHSNPQNHGYAADFRKYEWSSYNALASNAATKLMKDDVIDWFGNNDGFVDFHKYKADYNGLVILED